mmetsp:Transcript_23586/g.54820  ORF Transcript_23586/g.54820 Transcript_23586/m.54820 type:complete len:326 (+) Transcript_23586:649-1626(+)
MLRPAVDQNFDIADEKGPNQLHRITTEDIVNMVISIHILEARERPHKLGWDLLQDRLTIPGDLPVRGLHDQGLVPDKGATYRQLQKSRLAVNRELGGAIAALDGDVVIFDQPVVATCQDVHRIRFRSPEEAAVEDGDVRISPDSARTLHRNDAGLQAELGAAATSLREEEAQGHGSSLGKVEAVDIKRLLHRVVHTTQINHKLIVHENPNVIIAAECEAITTCVHKSRVKLKGEVEVVLQAIQCQSTVLPAHTINGEEAWIIMHVGPSFGLVQIQFEVDSPVHSRNIPKPLIKVGLVRQLISAHVDGLLVGAQDGSDEPLRMPIH